MIPYSTQDITDADIRAVARSLRSKWLTQGPAVIAFEGAVARRVGAKYGVAVNSGTAALHAAYFAAGIGKGDEVLVPAITFAATANAVLYCGATPVFVDCDPTTGTMSVRDAERKITARTKVIAPVDYAGRPAELRELIVLAKKHNLLVVEDAAQSLGAIYRGKMVGSIADITTFSFHPVKSIATGEGGMVVTSDKELAARARLFRSHGITKDADTFAQRHYGEWYQEMQALGFNYRMPEMCAALGTSQLKRLNTFLNNRRRAAARYHILLKDISGVHLPPLDRTHESSAWHLFPVQLAQELVPHRDEILSALRAKGIGVQVHHLPVYQHVYYKQHGYESIVCPNAERYVAAEISLPLFSRITVEQQRFITRTLKTLLARYSQ